MVPVSGLLVSAAHYRCSMLSSLWQTAIGAAAAIVGGLGAAIWQTRRADDVARRIRLAERREQGLLELDALVAGLEFRLDDLNRAVERGENQWQYQEPARVLGDLALHWHSKSSGVIPDPEVVAAYNAVDVAAHHLLIAAGLGNRV